MITARDQLVTILEKGTNTVDDCVDIAPIERNVKGARGLDHDISSPWGQTGSATGGRRREGPKTATAEAVDRIIREAGAEPSPSPAGLPDAYAAAQLALQTPDTLTALEYGVAVSNALADWTRERIATLLAKMNQDHAVVSLGSSVRYLHRATSSDGLPELRFLSDRDMAALYAAVIVPIERAITTSEGTAIKRKATPAFSLWRQWPQRAQYDGVGLFPNTKPPKGYLNLWTGFAVEPLEGDWSKFRNHIRNVICGGNEDIDRWVMDWLADIFQNPQRKPGSALVLKSASKGTGKTILNAVLKRLLGAHAASVDKKDHLTGKFNGHLQALLVLGVEEAYWAGDKGAAGTLKSLITEARITIENKGVNAYDAPNYTRLVFTSNENWAVPVGVDERRFMVLEVSNPQANRREYFDPIFKQLETEGGFEAMLHELLNRKITSDLRRPPETAALKNQREHSLDPLQRWVWTLAREGEFTNPEPIDATSNFADPKVILLSEKDPTSASCGVVRGAAKKACPGFREATVDTDLGELFRKLGINRRQLGSARRPHYEFPPLPELRKAVERELKVDCAPQATEHLPEVEAGRLFVGVRTAARSAVPAGGPAWLDAICP